jgi:hypothetical protein
MDMEGLRRQSQVNSPLAHANTLAFNRYSYITIT